MESTTKDHFFGKWFDLSEFCELKEFYQACYQYHRNEFDPELMFQDWENIPGFLITEYSLHKDTFQYFQAVDQMSQDQAEAFQLYTYHILASES